MKRTLNTIIFLLAAITLMAQNSFIVADKNGNSQLVQSLIFQQDASNDRFSWNTNNDANGYQQARDIKDLLFIARANSTLTTGTVEEVTQMLEELSGTDKADAEAVAETLKGNSNVVDAYSADGNNLIVKKDNDSYVIYPMYEMKAPFSELPQLTSRESSVRKVPSPRRVLENSDKIAIFNFFDGMSGYEVQNTIVSSFITELAFAGYTAECYGHPAISGRDFSYANLNYVLEHSEDYAAIAIFSHGAKLDDGTSCFCTRELAGDNDSRIRNDADKKYYKSYSASIQTNNNCILYLGICDGLNEDNFNSTSPVIGYSGKTCMAQANYCMLLYLMLVEGYTLENAINALPKEPAPNQETKIYRSNKVNGRDLTLDCNSRITNYFHSVSLEYNLINNRKMGYILAGKYEGTLPHKGWGSAEFIPITGDYNWWQSYVKYRDVFLKKHFFVNEEKKFSIRLGFLEDMPEGVFICRIYGYENEVGDDGLRDIKLVKPRIYRFLVNSKNFKENSADEVLAEEDFYTPSILDASGQTISEISVPVGKSQTFALTGYSGHTFNVVTLNTEVVDVSVSGTTLTVKGLKEGKTHLGVYDEQNKQMAIAEVTVTAGGNEGMAPADLQAVYLGLPSGTLWANMNVGAEKPEDYGLYFAWGKTTGYTGDISEYCTVNNKTVLDAENDAAHVNWGGSWRMPTLADYKELLDNTTSEWTTLNGVNGRLFTSKINGNSIFLPAAGSAWDGKLYHVGSYGDYWSSTPESGLYAYYLNFDSSITYRGSVYRGSGLTVRPVLKNPSLTLSVSTSNLSIAEGDASTVNITSGSGEYGVTNLNSDIAKATLDGTTITINAIAAGEAKIVVMDIQTKHEIIIMITVTAKSSGDTPAGLQAVDLGLPSSTLWANMNVGAEKPEDYGLYFAWGETTGYTGDTSDGRTFYWDSYKWCNGSETTLTKYCTNSYYGTVDNKAVLELEDDAAHVNLGGSWRMPTLADINELLDNTTDEWITQNGVNGRKFTSKTNGNSIFLPAAGCRWESDLIGAGSGGQYWSSSLYESYSFYAYYLYFNSSYAWRGSSGYDPRSCGLTVRPVRKN